MAQPNVFLWCFTNNYGVDQCGPTMTVGELIERLREFDPDSPVYFRDPSGYGSTCFYGSVNEDDVNCEEDEEW